MGQGGSRFAGKVPRIDGYKARKCRQFDARTNDAVAHALRYIYKVPTEYLHMYPKYNEEMALTDLRACTAGQSPPYAAYVPRYHRIAGGGRNPKQSAQDMDRSIVAMALTRLHGFPSSDLSEVLARVPYTPDMARQNLKRQHQGRAPRYKVNRYGLDVTNTKTGTVYRPGDKGYASGYKYNKVAERRRYARARHHAEFIGARGEMQRQLLNWHAKGAAMPDGRLPDSLDPRQLPRAAKRWNPDTQDRRKAQGKGGGIVRGGAAPGPRPGMMPALVGGGGGAAAMTGRQARKERRLQRRAERRAAAAAGGGSGSGSGSGNGNGVAPGTPRR